MIVLKKYEEVSEGKKRRSWILNRNRFVADAKTEVDAEAEARAEAEAETEVEADVHAMSRPMFFWRQQKRRSKAEGTDEGRRMQDQDASYRRWFRASELTEVRNLDSFEDVRRSFRRGKKDEAGS